MLDPPLSYLGRMRLNSLQVLDPQPQQIPHSDVSGVVRATELRHIHVIPVNTLIQISGQDG